MLFGLCPTVWEPRCGPSREQGADCQCLTKPQLPSGHQGSALREVIMSSLFFPPVPPDREARGKREMGTCQLFGGVRTKARKECDW